MPSTQSLSETNFSALERGAQAFIAVVVVSGLSVIIHSAHQLYSSHMTPQWFLLAALTLLSGSITVKLPSVPATLSVSETFVFTSVLLFGTAAGTITVTLDGLIISLWLKRNKLAFYKLLFNTTAPALSIWIAAKIFFALTGASPLSGSSTSIASLLPGLAVFAATYFLLNSWLMATAVSFDEPLTPLQVWRQNFLWLSLTFFSGASVSILLVSISREINLSALAVIVPLLVISYLTYHTSLGRIEDANRHVHNLNHLYLSTIETLAMAIDAKDQVTHGHIRRVQERSVSLARHLGVHDERLIEAVKAASLLHDMGKLAIPEHILNKPGRLSVAEFDVMKTHASIGADLLAAIEFPYPVVPIVRHHHENWNGSGYPHGLSGTDIPIGARILAVVDCFDALTSDRPYRPRLAFEDAIQILKDRRGTMYDPLVTDAFIAMISTEPSQSHSASGTYTVSSTPTTDIAKPDILTRLRDRAFPADLSAQVGCLTKDHNNVLVLFVPDGRSCDLVVANTWGSDNNELLHLRIPIGKRVSGWVAASGHPVFDTDASLDFLDRRTVAGGQTMCCDSAPVKFNNQTLGVLTLYRSERHKGSNLERDLIRLAEHISGYLTSQVASV